MATTQYTQANRKMRLSTPLGDDVLLLQNLTYKEEFGRPFEMTLEMYSTDGRIDFNKIIGRSVTVTIQMPQEPPSGGGETQRYLNGFVQSFRQLSYNSNDDLYPYHATVVPWISRLALTAGCQTFLNQSIPEIIAGVFNANGFSDFSFALTEDYPSQNFCVQYNESSLDFVQRKMEDAGISYYFQHSDSSHSITLTDSPSAKIPFPGYAKIPYNPQKTMLAQYIDSWSVGQSATPSSFTLSDYDYTSPNTQMAATAEMPENQADSSYNWYSYPGDYNASENREARAKIRLEQIGCRRRVCTGGGNLLGVSAGYIFTLNAFPDEAQNVSQLVTSSLLTISSPPYSSEMEGAGEEEQFRYRTEFQTITHGIPFRPARITPRPRIDGYQTAIVVGPQGQEVTQPHTNPYGCIQVRFHWQLNGSPNTGTSIWVRVAHPSAGPGWGHMFTPRIGNEVVIAFEDGNPDRPLIVGSVYNAVNMPPLPLPLFSTHSYITDDGDNVFAMIPTKENQAVIISTPYNKTRKVWGSNPR